jgi:hypothetical protein
LIVSNSCVARSLPAVELTIQPTEVNDTDKQYRLLPTEDELTDTDAVPLYQEAIRTLPDRSQLRQFSEWRSMPVELLPVKQVEAELQKYKTNLDLVARAARCKQCNWPARTPGQATNADMEEIGQYRQLAFMLEVQSRIQASQGNYSESVNTLKTLIAMSRHQGYSPILTQGLSGVAMATLALRQIDNTAQDTNAPNLYYALENLPVPLVDLSQTIDLEIANLKNYNLLVRRQFEKQLKPAHDLIRKQMNYLDRKVAALQCIEAMRLYAGAHEGKFPDKLSDVTEITVPDDPVAKKAFSYSRTGSKAMLEAEATEDSEGRDAIRYELNFIEK